MIFAKQEQVQLGEMICPVSGRTFVTRPEWSLKSSHHSYRFGVLDGEIILCQSCGRTYAEDILQYCRVLESILLEFRKPGRKMVLLEDYTHLGATDNASRQIFIKFQLAHQEELHGIFFFGMNSFLKLFVRLTRRLFSLRMVFDSCKHYEDALSQAHRLLGRPLSRKKSPSIEGTTTWEGVSLSVKFHSLDPRRILRFEFQGRLTKVDLPELVRATEAFLLRQSLQANQYLKVVDYTEVKSVEWGALFGFARELNRFDQLFPPRRHLVRGFPWKWRLMLAFLNLDFLRRISFIPTKADLEPHLSLVAAQAFSDSEGGPVQGFFSRLQAFFFRDESKVAQTLMEFIGEIQWDSPTTGVNPYPPHHPFHQVATSLLVVKADFDQLISDRDRREKELESARERAEESNRLQARFLANVSHEIRTPLNGIIGMGEMMAGTSLSPQQGDLLQTMRQSGQGLLTVINDILDLSRMEAGEFHLTSQSFDASQLLEDVGRMLGYLATKKGLDWQVRKFSELPGSLKGDPVRLRQILINLGGNAVKFTERGTVTMEVRRVGTTASGVVLQFQVEDTGPGIPPDRIGELFLPFRQIDGSLSRRHGGTGLGLAIAHNLVRQMGGNLGVESTPKGSIFTFRLVLPLGEPLATRIESSFGESVPLSGRILVAEDNRVNQKVVMGLLGKLGMEADIAENGRLAIDRLAAHPGEYQMVLMDIQMPEMDGLEAVKRLRAGEAGEEARRIPVIAVTAHAMEGDRELFLEQGMDDYLSKPLRLNELRATVENWLSVERN